MNRDDEFRLEKLKLVKEWPVALVVLQSAAVGVAVGILAHRPPRGWYLLLAIATFAAMLAAIYVGGVSVAGTTPAITRELTSSRGMDICAMRGELVEQVAGRWASSACRSSCSV